jgi:hypothetical protein
MLPLSIRYGKVYLKYTKLLKESQWWSEERLEEYQWRKLETLLNHAYENVSYYRRVFDERGIKPKDVILFKRADSNDLYQKMHQVLKNLSSFIPKYASIEAYDNLKTIEKIYRNLSSDNQVGHNPRGHIQ